MTDPTPDIVARLREQEKAAWSGGWRKGETQVVIREAAAEIERLQAENAKLLRAVQLWANADAEEH